MDDSLPVLYIPDDIEIRILDVLLDPDCLALSVKEKIEKMDISKATYYNHMNKPEFAAYCRQLVYKTIEQNSLQLITSAVKFAKAGSFQHLKLLLEMGDLHSDKQTVQLEGAVEHIVTFGNGNAIDVTPKSIEGPDGQDED